MVFEAKLGDFFRVARTHRPAKSLTGIRGSLEWCALPDTLMAKVELEGEFSEFPWLRLRSVFARMPGREAGPRLGGGK